LRATGHRDNLVAPKARSYRADCLVSELKKMPPGGGIFYRRTIE